MKIVILALSMTLVLISTAQAQTPVVSATTSAQFVASADHNTVLGGVTLLTNYRLETNIYTTTLGPLSFSKNLGKPTPGAGGIITVVVPEFGALPQGSYEARVFAVGPGGEAATPFTSPFVRISAPPAAPTALTLVP